MILFFSLSHLWNTKCIISDTTEWTKSFSTVITIKQAGVEGTREEKTRQKKELKIARYEHKLSWATNESARSLSNNMAFNTFWVENKMIKKTMDSFMHGWNCSWSILFKLSEKKFNWFFYSVKNKLKKSDKVHEIDINSSSMNWDRFSISSCSSILNQRIR